jgi:quinol monooxygenase YgiN
MKIFFATLKVKPGKEKDFERLQQELSRLTHESEPDTHVYDVIRHAGKPGVYAVYARFKDEAAFQYHQTTPFHERLVPPIFECLDGGAAGMDLNFYEFVG